MRKRQISGFLIPCETESGMNNNVELLAILTRVRNQRPVNDKDVRKIVDQYMSEVQWSMVKDEWTKHMSEEQKTAFCVKLLTESEKK